MEFKLKAAPIGSLKPKILIIDLEILKGCYITIMN